MSFLQCKYLDDIDYKIDFLAEFIKLSNNRKKHYTSNYSMLSKKKIEDFEKLFDEYEYNMEERHYSIINSAFRVIHRVHSGSLQQIMRRRFRDDEELPGYNVFLQNRYANQIPQEIRKFYRQIKFEYCMNYYCTDALLAPIFIFFWGVAEHIYAEYDFLYSEVKRLSNKSNQCQASTKILVVEIVEKILIGNFVTPEEIMIVKSDLIEFERLIKLRPFLQIEGGVVVA